MVQPTRPHGGGQAVVVPQTRVDALFQKQLQGNIINFYKSETNRVKFHIHRPPEAEPYENESQMRSTGEYYAACGHSQ